MIERKEVHGQLDTMIERIDAQIHEAHKGMKGQRPVPSLGDLFGMVKLACEVMEVCPGVIDEIDIDFDIDNEAWRNIYAVILGSPVNGCVLFDAWYQCFSIIYLKNKKENTTHE